MDDTVYYYELYDLVNDFRESTHLAEIYPSISNTLLTEVDSWGKSMVDWQCPDYPKIIYIATYSDLLRICVIASYIAKKHY